MNEFTIHKHIAEVLNKNGFNVVSSETTEGYKKPAVFILVQPVSHERLMCDMEQITVSVELTYIPANETVVECTQISNRLVGLFYYSPFEVENTVFTVERIESNIDNYILTVNFELTYEQSMPGEDDDEEIENIEMEMNLYGNA